ncbi:DUF2303 family protein [Rhodoligotrophos ferricapiens]|uniref:DUF2303 family protein n=1 Tax=Rhodoligotrophos ferricapiens TaxID=3069264 RepID=UPI00315D2D34
MSEPLTADALEMLRNGIAASFAPIDNPSGGKTLLVPEGYRAENLPPIDPPLSDHIKQRITLLDTASFIAYVNDFKTAETRIIADNQALGFQAIFDYHGRPRIEQSQGTPARRAHRASFSPVKSEQFARWSAINGKATPQLEFAHFLEENLPDVAEPDGASLLEVALKLEASKKVEFVSGTRLNDGSQQLTYAETVETKAGQKGELRVPSELTIAIPIFFGGPVYSMKAFLRYRISDGKLHFIVDLHRLRYAVEMAFADFRTQIDAGTKLASLLGKIEGLA